MTDPRIRLCLIHSDTAPFFNNEFIKSNISAPPSLNSILCYIENLFYVVYFITGQLENHYSFCLARGISSNSSRRNNFQDHKFGLKSFAEGEATFRLIPKIQMREEGAFGRMKRVGRIENIIIQHEMSLGFVQNSNVVLFFKPWERQRSVSWKEIGNGIVKMTAPSPEWFNMVQKF